MLSYEGITTNFRYMAREVVKQLENTLLLLSAPSGRMAAQLRTADDYVDLQKSRIEQECFLWTRSAAQADERDAQTIRALGVIVANLERLADLAVDAARQVEYLRDATVLERYDCVSALRTLIAAARQVEPALLGRDAAMAATICEAEWDLDRRYAAAFAGLLRELEGGAPPADRLTALMLFHCLERMGDALQNIGEAVILAATGERLKYHEVRALTDSAGARGSSAVGRLEVRSIRGTRSGVHVGTLRPEAADHGERVIFKEGSAEKLAAEQKGAAAWARVMPGLAPRVIDYRGGPGHSTLLLEYLAGETMEQLLLGGSEERFAAGLGRLIDTLGRLWASTARAEPIASTFMAQLRARLNDVYRVHPRFRRPELRIGRATAAPLETLIEQAAAIEARLAAPLRVFGHGDLNLDNVLYDAERDELHLVDVHRSGEQDYVQDAAVLIASAMRLPVQGGTIAGRTHRLGRAVLGQVRAFATAQGDAMLEARLALGVARALLTATRYEFNRGRAERLRQRAVYLLERTIADAGDARVSFCEAILVD